MDTLSVISSTMPSQVVAGEEFLLMPWKVGANGKSWLGSTHKAEGKGGEHSQK
jgi:hypothetical protein